MQSILGGAVLDHAQRSDHRRDQEQHQRHQEHDLGDTDRRRGDAAEAEHGRDQRQDEAQRRVDSTGERMKQAADSARKAAAYLSFWTFMSLLFGAVCAALGGDLRDELAIRGAVPTAPL